MTWTTTRCAGTGKAAMFSSGWRVVKFVSACARGAILPIMWQISLEGHPQPDPTCDGCRPKYIGGSTALQPRPSTHHMASSSRITSCLACSTSTPLLLALMLLVMFKVHMCNLNPFGSSALNSTSTTVVVLWCSTLLMHLWCSSTFFWNDIVLSKKSTPSNSHSFHIKKYGSERGSKLNMASRAWSLTYRSGWLE